MPAHSFDMFSAGASILALASGGGTAKDPLIPSFAMYVMLLGFERIIRGEYVVELFNCIAATAKEQRVQRTDVEKYFELLESCTDGLVSGRTSAKFQEMLGPMASGSVSERSRKLRWLATCDFMTGRNVQDTGQAPYLTQFLRQWQQSGFDQILLRMIHPDPESRPPPAEVAESKWLDSDWIPDSEDDPDFAMSNGVDIGKCPSAADDMFAILLPLALRVGTFMVFYHMIPYICVFCGFCDVYLGWSACSLCCCCCDARSSGDTSEARTFPGAKWIATLVTCFVLSSTSAALLWGMPGSQLAQLLGLLVVFGTIYTGAQVGRNPELHEEMVKRFALCLWCSAIYFLAMTVALKLYLDAASRELGFLIEHGDEMRNRGAANQALPTLLLQVLEILVSWATGSAFWGLIAALFGLWQSKVHAAGAPRREAPARGLELVSFTTTPV